VDSVVAARRLMDALGTPFAFAMVGASAADFLLQAPKPDEILDMVMKRNLVFVSWRAGDETGTWALTFDRNGWLVNWTALQ
jgi:hypothetical protein